MYKYKKLQTLINYIVTKHGNTPQGASKITVSLLIQEVTQRAGTGGQRPERPSPYKNPAVVIPKAMYKLHSRKRGLAAGAAVPEKRACHLAAPRLESSGPLPPRGPSCSWHCRPSGCGHPPCPARWPGGTRGLRPEPGPEQGLAHSSVAKISINFFAASCSQHSEKGHLY